MADGIRLSVEGGSFGFLLGRNGETLLSHNADAPFYPASAIKVVHLVHALRTVEADLPAALAATLPRDGGCAAGGSHPAITLGDALTETMQASSNETANALQHHYGLEALAETIRLAGMEATELYHGFGCGGPANDPANQTTARDLASIFAQVASGEILGPQALDTFYVIVRDETVEVVGESEVGRVFLKEGWYGTTLTVGGVLVSAESGQGPAALPFAAFVHRADHIASDFDIKAVVSDMLTRAGVLRTGGGLGTP